MAAWDSSVVLKLIRTEIIIQLEGLWHLGHLGLKPMFGSGPTLLPTAGSKNENSNIYQFELGTNSPLSVARGEKTFF